MRVSVKRQHNVSSNCVKPLTEVWMNTGNELGEFKQIGNDGTPFHKTALTTRHIIRQQGLYTII